MYNEYKGKIMNLINMKSRLIDIQYQFLKDNTTIYSDDELVNIVTSIVAGIVSEIPSDEIIDSDMPTSLMGCTLDWSPGVTNDKVASITKGTARPVQVDLSTDYIPKSLADQVAAAYTLALAIVGEVVSASSYVYTTDAQELDDALILAHSITMTA